MASRVDNEMPALTKGKVGGGIRPSLKLHISVSDTPLGKVNWFCGQDMTEISMLCASNKFTKQIGKRF